MIPVAAISSAIVQARYTNGVASPLNGIENCGLKNVETAGPMIAADMITAPVRPTALRRRRGSGCGIRIPRVDGAGQTCLTSDDFCVKAMIESETMRTLHLVGSPTTRSRETAGVEATTPPGD